MAWVEIGNRKINTALICFMEQQDEKARLYFQGQQETVELQPDETRALWKFVKSENLMSAKDKGSAMVMPKRWNAMPDVAPVAGGLGAEKPAAPPAAVPSQPKPAMPTSGASPSQAPKPHVTISTSGSSNRPHSSSHSQPPKPAQVLHKTAEVKKV